MVQVLPLRLIVPVWAKAKVATQDSINSAVVARKKEICVFMCTEGFVGITPILLRLQSYNYFLTFASV